MNEKDHKAVTEYLINKKIELPFKLSQDTSLNRGDIIIKAGSIEVKELANKMKQTVSDRSDKKGAAA